MNMHHVVQCDSADRLGDSDDDELPTFTIFQFSIAAQSYFV